MVSLTAKEGTYDDNDPIGVLDVTISSNLILDEILGIKIFVLINESISWVVSVAWEN